MTENAYRDSVDVLVVDADAGTVIEITNVADQNSYRPALVVFGRPSTSDRISSGACRSSRSIFHGASAFTAWPAWSDTDAFDPDLRAAIDRFRDPEVPVRGEALVAGWGMMRSVHRILEAAGPDPSRSALLASLRAGHSHETGFFPPFSVTADHRAGATAMHRLEMDCATRAFRERDAFTTGY